MIKEVPYIKVAIEFVVSEREAKRATQRGSLPETFSTLRRTLYEGLSGNNTNCLDIEDVVITFDGQRPEPSTRKAK